MNNNKKLTIIALVAAVVCLSIGFAAFSSTLNINSTASINPTNNFKVVFADTVSGNGTTFTSYTTNNVNGTGTNGATGGSAVIDNTDKTSPNLSSVTANFTKPGQTVTYSLYVVDDSNYDAYITAITDNVSKSCAASQVNGATSSLVTEACKGISVSAQLGGSYTLPQIITKKGYKVLTVTLTYASDAQAVDGDFNVTFGGIEITVSTVTSSNNESGNGTSSNETDESCFIFENVYNNPSITTYSISDDCEVALVNAEIGIDETDATSLCGSDANTMVNTIASSIDLDTDSSRNLLILAGAIESVNNSGIKGKSILNYTCDDTVVIMPSTIDNYNVLEIGSFAFYNSALTSVTIPNTVESINNYAFYGNNLTSVSIPSSVITIGGWAFQNNNLSSVDISNGVITIGDNAFQYNNLTSVDIPNSVETIGERAFEMNNLESVTIGSGVKEIKNRAFFDKNVQLVCRENDEIKYGSDCDGNPTSVTYGTNALTSVKINRKQSEVTLGDFVFGWADGYSDDNIEWNKN